MAKIYGFKESNNNKSKENNKKKSNNSIKKYNYKKESNMVISSKIYSCPNIKKDNNPSKKPVKNIRSIKKIRTIKITHNINNKSLLENHKPLMSILIYHKFQETIVKDKIKPIKNLNSDNLLTLFFKIKKVNLSRNLLNK
jgi:hypothetical protein